MTAKQERPDVDVFLLMGDAFGASVFWLRRLAGFEGEIATIEQWRVKRDGSVRGIF